MMIRRLLLPISLIILSGIICWEFSINPQQSGFPSIVYAQDSADPCLSAAIAKSSAAVSITTATTTSIIPVSATTSVNVCGFVIVSNSTTTVNTIIIEFGTGATCGGGTTALTGAMANGLTSVSISSGSTGTQFTAPSGNGICILSTVGSTPTIMGYMTFVRRGV